MIGLHINNLGLDYQDNHANIKKNIQGFQFVLSFHEKYEKQNYFENESYIILLDGWIFNAPSYKKQAEFVLELYLNHKDNFPYELNGQFNIVIIDKKSGEFLYATDIFNFRKHFYFFKEKDIIISSDIRFIFNNLDNISLNNQPLIKNIQLPAFIDISETYFEDIYLIPHCGIFNSIKNSFEVYDIKRIEKKYESEYLNEEKFLKRLKEYVRNVHKNQPLLLELSGGLDSRFLLELFIELGLNVRTITYGLKFSDEVRFGELVAQKNKVKYDIFHLKPKDFIINANRYIKQTGGIDIFVQSVVYNVFSNYEEDIPRVLETGLGIHTTIGGDYYREDLRLKKLQFQKIPLICEDNFQFDISNPFEFAIKHRTLALLMLRQSSHREFHDDRYSMYSYDIYYMIRAIPEELLRSENYFYNLGKMVIKNSENVPLRQTLFDMSLPIELWKEANLIQGKREALALRAYREYNTVVYQNRYYSDFDMWLRANEDWKEMVEDLLISDKCILAKKFIDANYIKKCIEEHMKAEKSHMRNIVKWLSLELFLRDIDKDS